MALCCSSHASISAMSRTLQRGPKITLMLTQSLHSAGFPTGGAYTNMGYSRAPANVAAVGPAFLQYSEPHSHVKLDAYDASLRRMTAPGLAPQPPVRTIEGLNGESKAMKNKRCSKTRNRKADCRVGKAKRPEKKAEVACGPCR